MDDESQRIPDRVPNDAQGTCASTGNMPFWPLPAGVIPPQEPATPKQIPGFYNPNTQRIWKGKAYPKDFFESYKSRREESDWERRDREILDQQFPPIPPSEGELHKRALLQKNARFLYHNDPLECLRRICTVAIHSTEDIGEAKEFASRFFGHFKFDLLYPKHQEDWQGRFEQVFEQAKAKPEGLTKIADVTLYDFVLLRFVRELCPNLPPSYDMFTQDHVFRVLKWVTAKAVEAGSQGQAWCRLGYTIMTKDAAGRELGVGVDRQTFETATDLLSDHGVVLKLPGENGRKVGPRHYRLDGTIPGTLVMQRKPNGSMTLVLRKVAE